MLLFYVIKKISDNWALLFSQKLALKNKIPLYICFCLVPKFLDATVRHFDFMLKGKIKIVGIKIFPITDFYISFV